MANVSPKKFVKPFTMRADDQFFADLDDLRADERPLLTRSDFIRKLVTDAKEAKAKGSRRKK